MRHSIILFFIFCFGSLIAIVHGVAPLIVKEAVIVNAEKLAIDWVDKLEGQFDLPGKLEREKTEPAFRLLRLLKVNVQTQTRDDVDIELFDPTSFEDNEELGRVKSYTVYTRFGDRFISGGKKLSSSLEDPVFRSLFEDVLTTGYMVSHDHSETSGNFGISETDTSSDGVEVRNQRVIVVMLPLWRGDGVGAVARVEIIPTQQEAYLATLVQRVASISAAVLAVLATLVSIILIRWNAQRSRAAERAEYLARYDALTGTLNRRAVSEFFNQLDQSKEVQTAHFTYWTFDIDDFKQINDIYGHHVGDVVLKTIAERITNALPSDAIFSRLAGDEFAVILPRLIEDDEMAALSKTILDAARLPVICGNHQLEPTISMGISAFPTDSEKPSDIPVFADMALYNAKSLNKTGWERFGETIAEKVYRERQIGTELKRALANNSLQLHFQAQVDVQTSELIGFEALLRWFHPTLGRMNPAEFIAVAEKTGLIKEIDRWVLNEACRTAANWETEAKVAVNLSPVHFESGDIAGLIRNALQDSGLPGERLEIEITENVLLGSLESVTVIFNEIREMGVRIALDDFGTGYSNLSYLAHMPITKLKIDRSFVWALEDSPANATIVKGIINIANELALEVIAEGVETYEQLRFLKSLNCSLVQGYLYGKPSPDPFATLTPAVLVPRERLRTFEADIRHTRKAAHS
ncbi:MAG: bifunctional diguanylate cyclase/phosphodiesterase [Pseudomonadota bacterium]